MGRRAARRRTRREGAPEAWPDPGPPRLRRPPAGPLRPASVRAAAPRGRPREWLRPLRRPCRARPFTCRGRRPARSAHGAWRRERRPARAAGSLRAPRGLPFPASRSLCTRTTSCPAPCASSRSCDRIGNLSKFGPRYPSGSAGVDPGIPAGVGPKGRGAELQGRGGGIACVFPYPSASRALHTPLHPGSRACTPEVHLSTVSVQHAGPTPCRGALLPLAAHRCPGAYPAGSEACGQELFRTPQHSHTLLPLCTMWW